MNNRLVIYFHYDPRGQADTACRFAVQAMRKQARVLLFVHNGTLSEDSRAWLDENGIPFLERENVGLDVGAYRDALLHIGRETLDTFEEVILMNYTLAGPVCPLQDMFDKMQARPELDFWGLSRHYAMHSRRFGKRGEVPEHIQSHFIAVRRRMYTDFWQYWQRMTLPKSYEDSIRFHETRFTCYFSALGYRWDTVVNGETWRGTFVNPIMGCPADLILSESCPFFKRRSFFTPYADELRRTDGCAALRLYNCVKNGSDFPVDALVSSLLQTQPLTAMAQNLHWHYRLPTDTGASAVILKKDDLQNGRMLQPDQIYCLPMTFFCSATPHWYEKTGCWQENDPRLAAAAVLFDRYPMLGILGAALPLYPECARIKWKNWREDLPYVKECMHRWNIQVPLDESQPLPLPNGGCLLVRGSAFPQGLPPLKTRKDFWLLSLLAQQNGYYSADAESEEQAISRTDVYQASLWQVQTPGGAGKLLARRLKHALLSRKEADK